MDIGVGNSRLELVEGDITGMGVDAIVNAANAQLVLGGGVAGAIAMKGGPAIQQECDSIGGAAVGQAVITTGGNLKARHVIHAVGPRAGEKDADRKLHKAVTSALRVADQAKLASVALPAISTGIFGFDMQAAARIILGAVIDYLHGTTQLVRVVVCLHGGKNFRVFEQELIRRIDERGANPGK